jgi:hypothetical protein
MYNFKTSQSLLYEKIDFEVPMLNYHLNFQILLNSGVKMEAPEHLNPGKK